MLSYRHAFHAGNHADMLKHFTLFLVLFTLMLIAELSIMIHAIKKGPKNHVSNDSQNEAK